MSTVLSPIVSEFETQEAADSYDIWFQAKVQQALDDARPGIPHDEVSRSMQDRFVRLGEQGGSANLCLLEGRFENPEHPVSIEVMNTAIASRGANAVLRPMHNPPHPGEVLREYLGERSVEDSSVKFGLDLEMLSGLLLGTVPISLEIAHRLSLALGTSQEMWIGIQSQYDLTLNVV